MSLEDFLINFDDISSEEIIGYEGPDSYTLTASIKGSKYAAKYLKKKKANFKIFVEKLHTIKHPCIIPFIGFCKSIDDVSKDILVFKKAKTSLNSVFDQQEKNQAQLNDENTKMIIIYGIAQALNYLHKNNIFHGRLTPNNILLNDDNEPFISDFYFSIMFSDDNNSVEYLKKYNLYYYIDPLLLNNGENGYKSDIYSFAIITLQILSDTRKVFKEENIDELIYKLKNKNTFPMISSDLPEDLRHLLISCINEDIEKRPNFTQICQQLDKIITENIDDKEYFNEYKKKINNNTTEILDSIISEYKENADNGDPRSMYLYGKERYKGKKCNKNKKEGIFYIKKSARFGYKDAINKLNELRIDLADDQQQNQDNNINDIEKNNTYYTKNEKSEIVSLYKDTYYDQSDTNMKQVIEKTKKMVNETEPFNYDLKILENSSFVETKNSLAKLKLLIDLIKIGIPILLEGPTGSSKTFTAEIACKFKNIDVIKFSISSETTIKDLIGSMVSDENSLSSISMKYGPFYDAFVNGKIIILDEINLSSQDVLQCIESALDSGYLTVDLDGAPFRQMPKHEDFHLIATQNPSKGLYRGKRNKPDQKFNSKFQIIEFPEITIDELKEIANGLAKKFNYNNLNVVNDLVDFQKELSDSRKNKQDPQCFTIRDIAASIKAFSQDKNIYDTVITIYGSRFDKKVKTKIEKLLNEKYPSLCKKTNNFDVPQFPGCFYNKPLISAIKSILLSLQNHRNVIITGNDECGKTQLAFWMSKYYNQLNNKDDKTLFYRCTKDIRQADFIGQTVVSKSSNSIGTLVQWKDGFLTIGCKKGLCVVLDCINEAPSTVIERLNAILDEKYDDKDRILEIPECLNTPRVKINDDFRIIATSKNENLRDMTPAFLNRYDIISLENQLDDISNDEFENLLSILLKKYSNELTTDNIKINQEEIEEEEEEEEEEDDLEFEFIQSNDNSDKNVDKDSKNHSFLNFKEIIPILHKKILEIDEQNQKNISKISKICKSFVILSQKFKENKKINTDDIINIAINILHNSNEYQIPENIEKILLFKLTKSNDQFYYKKTPKLCSLFAKLLICSWIKQPVCLVGETGIGKTAAAVKFANIRPCINKKNKYKIHSFHKYTTISDLYGTTTILNGKIDFVSGDLTTAITNNMTFIGDEFNLSDEALMNSVSLAVDPVIENDIFIPGIGQTINISPEFFFIICQNPQNFHGRNKIPDSLARRFVFFNYPDNIDITNICKKIAKSNFDEEGFKNVNKEKINQFIENIGKYMKSLNEAELGIKWSLRDITVLFKRIFNSDNKDKYFGFDYYHHVLFYTLSPIPENSDTIKQVINIMSESFNINSADKNNLIRCYNASPTFNGTYLMKNNCGVLIKPNTKLFSQLKKTKLTNLWNAIFKLSLASDNEPILLVGDSCYKTYLSLLILAFPKIINLNQETTIDQLLGKLKLMTIEESKLFYIKYLEILLKRINLNSDTNGNFVNYDKNKIREMLENILMKIDDKTLGSFTYAFKHLAKKYLNKSPNDFSSSKYVIEFSPKGFLKAIIKNKSLVLEHIDFLPTVVLERFNEFISGNQILTLSEDINDTFTSKNSKELSNFGDDFRIVATCPLIHYDLISEPVKSRFTIICVENYTSEERKIVIKNIIGSNNLFNSSDLNNLKEFEESYSKKFKICVNFKQLIKIIELTMKMNKETNIKYQSRNIGIVLYRVLGGRMKLNDKNDLIALIKKHNFDIPDIYQSLNCQDLKLENKCMYEIKEKNGGYGMESLMNGLFLKCQNIFIPKNIEDKIAFTPSFNNLLDIIHLCLTIHYPLILEGPPGLGKHTAIDLITQKLNIETEHIIISQSNKVEDIYGIGKETINNEDNIISIKQISTKFNDIIKGKIKNNRILIIIDNLENSSDAVLNSLDTVFDKNRIDKCQYDIIGIMSNHRNLTDYMINSSLHYKTNKLRNIEVFSVIYKNFIASGLTQKEAERFYDCYQKANSVMKQSPSNFTLDDINKYITLRTKTKDCFDESIIKSMIFGSRFYNDKNMLQLLNLDQIKFEPTFTYSSDELLIRSSEESQKVLSLQTKQKDKSYISKVNTLTLPQKHCLVFLANSYKARRPCVIEGETGIGKSHIIRLFSDLMEKELIIYQVNSDSNTYMFDEHFVLKKRSLSEKDIEEFKTAFDDLSSEEIIRDYLHDQNNININEPSTWNLQIFNKFFDFIDKNKETINLSSNKTKIEESIKTLKEKLQPINRFESNRRQSEFVDAMINGKWVLIDGIEASIPILEKIYTLFGVNPELNLYEFGKNKNYSKDPNMPIKQRIHKDFQLFITYSTTSSEKEKNIIDNLLSKALRFKLPPIDRRIEDTAQFIYSSLVEQSYNNNDAKELACRLARVHMEMKKNSEENKDDFAGEIIFNGRTLLFITKAFQFFKNIVDESHNDKLHIPISFSIKSFYWNSYTNKEKEIEFQSNCIEALKQSPQKEILDNLNINNNFRETNKPFLILLRNIQILITSNRKLEYSLSNLIDKLYNAKICHLYYIQYHLNDTVKIIESYAKSCKDQKQNPLIIFGIFISLNSFLNEILSFQNIRNEINSLQLSDKLLKNETPFSVIIAKFDLLYCLVQNTERQQYLSKSYFSQDCSILLKNELYQNIITLVKKIIDRQDKKAIIELFDNINEKTIKFINKIFPYYKFSNFNESDKNKADLSLIVFLLPIAKKLILKNIHCIFIIDGKHFEYNKSSKCKYSPTFKMNHENKLTLSEGSNIQIESEPFQLPKIKTRKKHVNESAQKQISIAFYNVILSLLSNDYQEDITISILNEILTKKKKMKNTTKNKALSIFSLFISGNSSLIGMIWNLIFSIPEDIIICLSDLINPLEKEILLQALKMYSNSTQVNIQETIKWTEKVINIENKTQKLSKLLLKCENIEQNTNTIANTNTNINKLIKETETEMIYFKENYMNVFMSSQKYLDLYKNEIDYLYKLKKEIISQEKQKLLEDKFLQLTNSFKKFTCYSKTYLDMRDQIIDYIENNETKNEEFYQYANEIINDFKKEVNSDIIIENNNKIYWPFTEKFKTYQEDKNSNHNEYVQLFISLKWYSNVKILINKLRANNDIIENIMKLESFNENDETTFLQKILLDEYIKKSKNNRSGLTHMLKEHSEFILQANMIEKLWSSNESFIREPNKIFDMINNLEKRNSCNDLEYWIYGQTDEIQQDFEFIMPTFNYMALVFLVVIFEPSGNNYDVGPLFKDIKDDIDQTFLEDQIELKNYSFNSFVDAAKSIGKIAYYTLIEPQTEEPPPDDYEELKHVFTNPTNYTQIEKIIYDRILSIFSIAEFLDKWPKEQKLTFNDISFLKTEWLGNDALLNQYPSLFFWIWKNQTCALQLKELYHGFQEKSNKIPFWLICLRILSSNQCIQFQSNDNIGSYYEIINNVVTNKILEHIENSKNQKILINNNWLNILTTKYPPTMIIEDISLIYNFFNNLASENNFNQSELIVDLKKQNIQNSISCIIDLVLKDKYHSLLNDEINETNENIQFITNPTHFIMSKIDQYLTQTIRTFSSKPSLDQLKLLLNQNQLNEIKTSLISSIKEDIMDAKDMHLENKSNFRFKYLIMFGEIESDKFIKKAEKLQILFENFKPLLFDAINDGKMITQDTLHMIQKCQTLLTKLLNNLKVQFIDNSPAESTDEIVQKNLKPFLQNINSIIENVIKLIYNDYIPTFKALDIKKTKLFNNNYDIIIPNIKQTIVETPDFSSLTNIESLISPVFSLSQDNTIESSLDILECQVGPIFPSLMNDRYVKINLISLIDKDMKCSFDKVTKKNLSKTMSIKERVYKQEPIQLYIKPPLIRKKDEECWDLKGGFNIEIDGIKDFHYDFFIKLFILPLKVRVTSNYDLINEIDNNFRLYCNKINSGDQIDFTITNYYIPNQFLLDKNYVIKPLDENNADQPDVKINEYNHTLSLVMPHVDQNQRSQFVLSFYFLSNFQCNIICDCIIVPFIFEFKAYDYIKKEFLTDNCSKINIERKQKLYFNINIPNKLHEKETGKLYIGSKVEIIEINENSIIFYREIDFSQTNVKEVSLEINNTKKKIDFINIDPYELYPFDENHKEMTNSYLSSFPCYMCNFSENRWLKINNFEEYNNLKPLDQSLIVTPFAYYINENNCTVIDYSDIVKVSNYNNNIHYIQATITKSNKSIINITLNNAEKETKEVPVDGFLIKKRKLTYYSILGYIADDKNNWFPVFNKYPNITKFSKLPYKTDKNIISTAKKNISIMFQSTKIEHAKKFFEKNEYPTIPQSDFTFMMILLYEKNIIINLNAIIDEFPHVLKEKLKETIDEIQAYINLGSSLPSDIGIIISHNLILKFVEIFEERYREIKLHLNCLQFKITNDAIDEQIKKAYFELIKYNDVDPIESKRQFDELLKQQEIELSKIIGELPENKPKSKFFLLCENHSPLISEGLFKRLLSNESENSIKLKQCKGVSLPDINLAEPFSINELKRFFTNCSTGAKVLPMYILNCKLTNSDQHEAEIYFMKLLNVFNDVTNNQEKYMLTHKLRNNKSILSTSINSFIESFQNCITKLKNVRANFDKVVLPKILNEINVQDYIEIPYYKLPSFPPYEWKKKEQNKTKKIFQDDKPVKVISMHINESKDNSVPVSYSILNNKYSSFTFTFENKSKDYSYNNPRTKIDDNTILINAPVAYGDSDDSEQDDQDVQDDNVDFIEQDETENEMILKQKGADSKFVNVSQNEFEQLTYQMSERNILETIMENIKNIDPNSEIKHTSKDSFSFPPEEFFETNETDFPVKKLVDESLNIVGKLVLKTSEIDCPFLSMSCNLLIDCSKYISMKSKLFNFLILSAFSNALAILEIPFTISVFADENFKYVLKKYDDELSNSILQRVLDCLFIERSKSNVYHSIYHTVHEFKLNNRIHRSIFVFSNGFDDKFFFIKCWKEKIAIDPNISINMIFSKSEILNDTIIQMWDEFNKSMKESQIKIKITPINPFPTEDIFDEISKVFADTLSRPLISNAFEEKITKSIKPDYENINQEFNQQLFSKINVYITSDIVNSDRIVQKINSHFNYKERNDNRINQNLFPNKDSFICVSNVNKSIKNEFVHFIKKQITKKQNTYKNLLRQIFIANKPTQFILSDTGVSIHIPSFVLHEINKSLCPNIYLVKKGGYVGNYDVTMIIDSSVSCFNNISSYHSYQTMMALFSGLYAVDINCVDVIIATNSEPKVLCYNTPSTKAFDDKSPFWPSLFNFLEENSFSSCNLEASLHYALNLKKRRLDSTSYVYILTDGLYQKEQKEIIRNQIANLENYGIRTLCIGIGIYSAGISDIFPQMIFSPDPKNLIKGITYFGIKSKMFTKSIINIIPNNDKIIENINYVFDELIKHKDKPIFKELKDKLSKTLHGLEVSYYVNRTNKEIGPKRVCNQIVNPEGEFAEMYPRNHFKGQKILIVMLHDYSLNIEESHLLTKENLESPEKEGEPTVKDAVGFYGIELDVVQNYEDAIKRITSKTDGKCPYYAIWILSGMNIDLLPNNGNAKLVLEFNKCVLKFWENGGALVLFTDGRKLTFQANLLLESIVFPGNVKTKIQLGGENEGKHILTNDDTGCLNKPGTFDHSGKYNQTCARPPLSKDLYVMSEGVTTSFVLDESQIYPFKPFIRDSGGHIAGLYFQGDLYNGDIKNVRGDIIIDCGYTKLFDGMSSIGTMRYISNIAAWIMQLNFKNEQNRFDPISLRPDAVDFTIDRNNIYDKFDPLPKLLSKDTMMNESRFNHRIFAIDYSGSTDKVEFYHKTVKQIFDRYYKEGDTIILWTDYYKIIDKKQMDEITAKREGTSGTEPIYIAKALLDKKDIPREHLILVTDGNIGPTDIENTTKFVNDNNIVFKYASIFIIDEYVTDWDKCGKLSVGISFCRNNPCEKRGFSKSGEKIDSIQNDNDIKILENIDEINDVEDFRKKFQSLRRSISAKMYRLPENTQLVKQIQNLKERLIKSPKYRLNDEGLITHLEDWALGKYKDQETLNDADSVAF